MQKVKSYNVDPTKVNLLDWIFGLNNAWGWWETSDLVHFNFKWEGGESTGQANGEQLMDVVIGLVSKYNWQDMKGILNKRLSQAGFLKPPH